MVLATLLPSLSKVAIIVDFKINQYKIAQKYCINIDKPEVMCGGKCYLNDQLNKMNEESNSRLPQNLKLKNEAQFLEPIFALATFDVTTANKKHVKINSYYNQFISSHLSTDIFHPPQV
ncbi:MAG TPA: hypothetical protein PKD18_13805 [Saprospiraceae bacterium]|nr:hypothetical protein [Saprospiraceae bacterium]